MKTITSSKLRLLFWFGVIVFISLLLPTKVSAHNGAVGGREAGVVYDGDNPWDGTYVGWFNCDKLVSSGATGKWYTKGFRITTYPLSDYTIPGGAYDPGSAFLKQNYNCSNGMVDTAYLFDRQQVVKWATKSGASFSDDGTLTIYLQPVIGTKTKNKSGAWVDDGVSLYSLSAWVNAKKWANTSTFASHYNKPLRIKYTPSTPEECTQISYQTLNSGEGYSAGTTLRDGGSYSYTIGSVHSYADTGLISYMDATIDGETRRFVLAGVKVEKADGYTVGTSGRLAIGTDENNMVIPSSSYGTIDGSLSDAGSIPGSGWTFRKDYSSVYNYVNGCTFRVSMSTRITYLYAEVKTTCKLYTGVLYDGYDAMNVLNANTPYKVNAGGTFDYSGESALVPATSSYKGYVWDLVKAAVYKKGANILVKPTVYANNISSVFQYNRLLTLEEVLDITSFTSYNYLSK